MRSASASRPHEQLAFIEGQSCPVGPAAIGWHIKRQSGSHKTLSREGWPDYVFAFHERDEIGPNMLKRIAKHTGLKPEDL